MYELEVGEIADLIDSTPLDVNLMLLGDTGIGKTQSVERYCKEKGLYLKTLILSQLEASETLGVPVKTQREWQGQLFDCLSVAVPEWVFDLAEHQDDGAVLFLDEFLCAQPSVMNAFLNFLTQKNVHGIDLHKVRIIAATNVGNYTFDPDNNILSRFCWFYLVNSHATEWLKDERIINNYRDENPREGVIFERRSLKPRCQQWLQAVDDDHLQMFYEGFTNCKYVMVHRDHEINDVIAPYFVPLDRRHFTIADENIKPAVSMMVKTFNRIRKWDKIVSSFVNIPLDVAKKIADAVVDVTGVPLEDDVNG